MKRITLSEIAERAGVSVSTVSRVLNGHPVVNERTRQRVIECLEEMNYSADPLVAAAPSGVKTVLAVFASYTREMSDNRYFADFLSGIQSSLDPEAWRIQWQLAGPYGELDGHTRAILGRRAVDGVIFVTRTCSEENLRLAAECEIPFVLVGRPSDRHSCVYIDDRAAGRDVARLLVERGHRKMAFLGDPDASEGIAFRAQGFREVIEATREGRLVVVPCDPDEAGGYQGTDRLLEHEPTAVFAACDAVAVGALKRLKERQISVPEQLSIVGYDGDAVSAYTDPPLATVAAPLREIGEMTAKILQELMLYPKIDRAQVQYKYELVLRASVGDGPFSEKGVEPENERAMS